MSTSQASPKAKVLRLNSQSAALNSREFGPEAVFELTKSFGKDPGFYWPMNHIQDEFAHSECWGLVHEGILKAACFIADRLDVIEVIMLAVGADFRRGGFGKTLLNQIFETYHGKEVWLEVHRDNLTAIQFYLHLGFKKVGLRPAYYRDGADAILMSRPAVGQVS